MLKTRTSNYPILKLACPQAILLNKAHESCRETTKTLNKQRSQFSYIQILYMLQSQYVSSTYINALVNYQNLTMCLHLVEHSHSTGKETLQFIIMHSLLENSQGVLMLSTLIQYMQTKIKRAFIRLIMGLGGHDNWVRDEFLAVVEL